MANLPFLCSNVECCCGATIYQTLIERLLTMLQDPDYRVRFSLARRIGVLFQTWDGHEELFHDIWWVSTAISFVFFPYYHINAVHNVMCGLFMYLFLILFFNFLILL